MNIESYEQACEVLNLSAEDRKLPFAGEELTVRQKNSNAYFKLKVIIAAANSDVEHESFFYEPAFKTSGSGWVYDDYVHWHTCTTFGPRLRYNGYDLMRWHIKQHDALYQDLMN